WIDVISKLGVPVAALVALGWGIWRIIVWVGTNLVIPMRDKHTQFLDMMIQHTRCEEQITDQLVQLNRDQAVALGKIAQTQVEQTTLLREYGEILRRLDAGKKG